MSVEGGISRWLSREERGGQAAFTIFKADPEELFHISPIKH